MAAVLQRLKPLIGAVPRRPEEGESLTWEFGQDFLEKGKEYFTPLIRINPVFMIEYSVHCSRLVEDFQSKADKEEFAPQLTEQLIDALVMAELLSHIFHYYLCVPREVRRLKKEQEIFRQLLSERGFRFPEKKWPEIDTSTVAQNIRSETAKLNPLRLFVVRLRRAMITLAPIIKEAKRYSAFVTIVDKYVGPVLSYLSWIFYIPRLAVSVLLFVKHLLPFWLDPEEKSLGWRFRLLTQFNRRWFLIGNDFAWMVAGILTCFILIGSLSAVGMYVTVSLYAFDFAMAGIRAFIELHRLYSLQSEYEVLLQAAVSGIERKELSGYLAHLNKRIGFEEKRLLLSVFSTCSLFLGMLCVLPALAAINPLIPFIGAVVVVLIALGTYVAEKWLEKRRPKDRVLELEPRLETEFEPEPVFVLEPEPVVPDKWELNNSNRMFVPFGGCEPNNGLPFNNPSLIMGH